MKAKNDQMGVWGYLETEAEDRKKEKKTETETETESFFWLSFGFCQKNPSL